VRLHHEGREVRLRVEQSDHNALLINGVEMPFTYADHPYRPGGMVINRAAYLARLSQPENHLCIRLNLAGRSAAGN
jgi:hypothetical protein